MLRGLDFGRHEGDYQKINLRLVFYYLKNKPLLFFNKKCKIYYNGYLKIKGDFFIYRRFLSFDFVFDYLAKG